MIQIICINKDGGDHLDPYEAITDLGWINPQTGKRGKSTREAVAQFIEDGNRVYVNQNGNVADLIAYESRSGSRCVKTEADDTDENNLLNLPEC